MGEGDIDGTQLLPWQQLHQGSVAALDICTETREVLLYQSSHFCAVFSLMPLAMLQQSPHEIYRKSSGIGSWQEPFFNCLMAATCWSKVQGPTDLCICAHKPVVASGCDSWQRRRTDGAPPGRAEWRSEHHAAAQQRLICSSVLEQPAGSCQRRHIRLLFLCRPHQSSFLTLQSLTPSAFPEHTAGMSAASYRLAAGLVGIQQGQDAAASPAKCD